MKYKLILGDCLLEMQVLISKGIKVDMILCDLPYGTTDCAWDTVIPFEPLWDCYKRIIKENGAIILTASQPFTSALVMSNPKLFKYEWIWEKNRGSGHLNAKIMPMKYHENILVFGDNITFNAIRESYSKTSTDRYNAGEVWKPKKKISNENIVYGKFKNENRVFLNPDGKSPSSIKYFKTVDIQNGSRIHPTQKPVDLMKYLILTYTNENETVLDNTMGSGTTGVACINLNRNFIGIEKEQEYFDMAKRRIKAEENQTKIFY